MRSLASHERKRVCERQAPVLHEERDDDNCAAAATGFAVDVRHAATCVHVLVDERDAAADRLERRRSKVGRGAHALHDASVCPVLWQCSGTWCVRQTVRSAAAVSTSESIALKELSTGAYVRGLTGVASRFGSSSAGSFIVTTAATPSSRVSCECQ